jgi:hypothetical protein
VDEVEKLLVVSLGWDIMSRVAFPFGQLLWKRCKPRIGHGSGILMSTTAIMAPGLDDEV